MLQDPFYKPKGETCSLAFGLDIWYRLCYTVKKCFLAKENLL